MKKYIFSLLVVSCFFLITVPNIAGEILEIPGTGASEILLKKLAVAFNEVHSGDVIKVPPSVGSRGGIRLVGEGSNIVGRVARVIKDEEKKYGLTYWVFAKDPVVFAVSRKVGVDNLTKQQLLDLYSGTVKNWQDVGGQNARVRLLIREPDDSSFLIIKEHIPAFKDVRFPVNAKSVYHDYEMVEMLQKYSTVIGWLTGSSLNTISQKVTSVAVDGIDPTAENILNGRYPLVSDYALVFKDDRLNPLARRFLHFLSSEEAARILENEGVIPVTSPVTL